MRTPTAPLQWPEFFRPLTRPACPAPDADTYGAIAVAWVLPTADAACLSRA
ncbi:MAG: hypothetical protein K2H17_01505 [Duncaniella sp.]|uniref:hypothetical protein n=1 Tax=Duncaniella sp. TaxID=2518496 RepID=UPI0023C443B7|nr:hypothetical protein [Duncaniella sp.]MDE5988053.1 hypothetical protein [Duncaniella sp.]